MLKMIRNKYWNPTAGIFTSGPNRSVAFKDEVWETAGEEGAVAEHQKIASEEQKNLIMDNPGHKIITPYGIPLMPGHLEKTHWQGLYGRFIRRDMQLQLRNLEKKNCLSL